MSGETAYRTISGRRRARPLVDTLEAAQSVAREAGITRLAEITALDRLALPIFQVSRPKAKCLSTSLGKGLTRRGAMVSALLEGIEIDAAERAAPIGIPCALNGLDETAFQTWCGAPRPDLAIRLDRHWSRNWMQGVDLLTGRLCPVPFDLVSLDFTLEDSPDLLTSTIGLASGGTQTESRASGLAELLEHELAAAWAALPPGNRQRARIDVSTIDDDLVMPAVRRIIDAGAHLHLWSLGHEQGIGAFYCVITDGTGAETSLPPNSGTGCHPDRTVAALLAILEAAQARAAMISGARDDLDHADYAHARDKTVAFVLETVSLSSSGLPWSALPSAACIEPEAALDMLLTSAIRASSLPIIAVALPSPHPWIAVTKVVAPGLRYIKRDRRYDAVCRSDQTPRVKAARRNQRRVVFVGPTLWGLPLPPGIERRPPAVVGDFAALLDDPPHAVGLIDGCFESGPSLWHKEILDLMAHGTTVYGAASLGALRAADLHEFGMLGIGTIFEAYRDGELVRDDAVMLCHGPGELAFQPMTLALVDVEAALKATPMSEGDRRMLQRIARTMSFRCRTWPAMFRQFETRLGRPPSVSETAIAGVPSLKCADAVAMVKALKACPGPPPRVSRPPLTSYYQTLLAQTRSTP